MDWLTVKDWEDLRMAAIAIAAFVVFGLLLHLFRQHRAKQPFWQRPRLGALLSDNFLLIVIIWLFAVEPILERRGVPGWFSTVCLLVVILVIGLLPLRHLQRDVAEKAALHGVDNPDGVTVPPVPLSRDEKRLQSKILIALIGVTIAVLALTFAVVQPFTASGNPSGGEGEGSLLGFLLIIGSLIGVPAFAIFGRWPWPVSRRAEIEIDATPQQVWNAIVYRDGMDHYRGIHSRIEKVEATVPTWRLHYQSDGNCGECGLPKHPDAGGITSLVQVLEADEPQRYVIRSAPKGLSADKGDAANWLDCEEESFDLAPLPGGRCRVASATTAQRPKVWLAVLIRVGDPLGEQLRDLKAFLEGREEDTLYAAARARFAAARNAPRHCGCSPAEALAFA